QTDSGNFTVTIKLPVGTALDKTNRTMQQVENILVQNPNVETAFSAAGTTLTLRGTSSQLLPNQGSATVRLKEDRKDSTQNVMLAVQKQLGQLPGVRANVLPFDLVTLILTGGNQNIEADIFGNDLHKLTEVSQDVLRQSRNIPGLMGADVNVQDATP